MPPTPSPMTKHMRKFIQYMGMEPQALVAMKMIPAIRMEARRPIRSPSHPQRKDPSTVPVIPQSGNKAAGTVPFGSTGDRSPYSFANPGSTNERVVGFITSIVTATAITTKSPICEELTDASSMARILM